MTAALAPACATFALAAALAVVGLANAPASAPRYSAAASADKTRSPAILSTSTEAERSALNLKLQKLFY